MIGLALFAAVGLAAAAAFRAAVADHRLNGRPATRRGPVLTLAGRPLVRMAPRLFTSPPWPRGAAEELPALRAGAVAVFGTAGMAGGAHDRRRHWMVRRVSRSSDSASATPICACEVSGAGSVTPSSGTHRRSSICWRRRSPAACQSMPLCAAAGQLPRAHWQTSSTSRSQTSTWAAGGETSCGRWPSGRRLPPWAASPLRSLLADRLGAPLADQLRAQARRARADRARVVQERAAAAGPRLLLVVVLVLVPAALLPLGAAVALSVAGSCVRVLRGRPGVPGHPSFA